VNNSYRILLSLKTNPFSRWFFFPEIAARSPFYRRRIQQTGSGLQGLSGLQNYRSILLVLVVVVRFFWGMDRLARMEEPQ
jgi:hypothetical protein